MNPNHFSSLFWIQKTLWDFSPTKTKLFSINIVNKLDSMVEIDKHQIDGSWTMLRRTEWRMGYLKTNVSTDDVTIYSEISSTSDV